MRLIILGSFGIVLLTAFLCLITGFGFWLDSGARDVWPSYVRAGFIPFLMVFGIAALFGIFGCSLLIVDGFDERAKETKRRRQQEEWDRIQRDRQLNTEIALYQHYGDNPPQYIIDAAFGKKH